MTLATCVYNVWLERNQSKAKDYNVTYYKYHARNSWFKSTDSQVRETYQLISKLLRWTKKYTSLKFLLLGSDLCYPEVGLSFYEFYTYLYISFPGNTKL